jgi:hypothetical protein
VSNKSSTHTKQNNTDKMATQQTMKSIPILYLFLQTLNTTAAQPMGGMNMDTSASLVMGANAASTEVMVWADSGSRSRTSSPCTWTSPSGDFYDFSDLSATGSESDYLVTIPHSNFGMLVNLCANALKVPARCATKSNSQASVGFQWNTKQPTSCWELGELSTGKFSYIDDASPEKGIDIMYSGGTPCSKGVRMIHYHMMCAGADTVEQKPSFAWEAPTCHYHVVWPTPLACKGYRSFSLVSFIEDWFLFLIFGAVVGALAFSIRRQQTQGTPVKETMGELFAKASEKTLDVVSNIKGGMGGGIGGGATNRSGGGGGNSGNDFGSGGMSPMPMGGDAL